MTHNEGTKYETEKMTRVIKTSRRKNKIQKGIKRKNERSNEREKEMQNERKKQGTT